MGNWQILIRGSGPHHNKDNPGDADRIAAGTVAALFKAGHRVKMAVFTIRGQEDNLTPSGQPSTVSLQTPTQGSAISRQR